MTPAHNTCSGSVPYRQRVGVGFRPCRLAGTVRRDGKTYCSRHDPVAKKARAEERELDHLARFKFGA